MASAAEIVRRSSHHTLTIQHRSYDVRVTEVVYVDLLITRSQFSIAAMMFV